MNFEILLENISNHISLNPEEIAFFSSLVKSRSLKTGTILLQEGQVCRHKTFITNGCFKSYYFDENGTEHIMDFLVEEWWADDLHSFFTETASRSNIKALENSQVIQISKSNLEVLYRKIPKFERFFRILFENAYISQRNQINSMQSMSAEERYFMLIKQKPYAEKRFSQKDIAYYLGLTPQFLSALKKKIRELKVD